MASIEILVPYQEQHQVSLLTPMYMHDCIYT